MGIHVLVSHSHKDKKIAEALSTIISEVNNEIVVWYSSDASGKGGIGAGEEWLETIKKRLANSDVIIALLTPGGLSRPWIYFESGFGAGKENCCVIPVCVGIDSLNDVPFPLAMYEAYQLLNYHSLDTFVSKLMARFSLAYDKEQAKPILEKGIQNVLDAVEEIKSTGDENFQDPVVTELKRHIDQRLFELTEKSSLTTEKKDRQYSVPIKVNFPNYQMEEYLVFQQQDSLQKAMDNIFFLISRKTEVPAFSYMIKWVLKERETGMVMAVRGITSMIPARYIFTPDSHWEAVPLEKPYDPADKETLVSIVRNYKPDRSLD